jgi:hypothetical protein
MLLMRAAFNTGPSPAMTPFDTHKGYLASLQAALVMRMTLCGIINTIESWNKEL